MNRNESGENQSQGASLEPIVQSMASFRRRIRRSVSPWVQRYMDRMPAQRSTHRMSFLQAATRRLVQRAQGQLDFAVATRPHLGSIEPSLIQRFSDYVANPFMAQVNRHQTTAANTAEAPAIDMPLLEGTGMAEPTGEVAESDSPPSYFTSEPPPALTERAGSPATPQAGPAAGEQPSIQRMPDARPGVSRFMQLRDAVAANMPGRGESARQPGSKDGLPQSTVHSSAPRPSASRIRRVARVEEIDPLALAEQNAQNEEAPANRPAEVKSAVPNRPITPGPTSVQRQLEDVPAAPTRSRPRLDIPELPSIETPPLGPNGEYNPVQRIRQARMSRVQRSQSLPSSKPDEPVESVQPETQKPNAPVRESAQHRKAVQQPASESTTQPFDKSGAGSGEHDQRPAPTIQTPLPAGRSELNVQRFSDQPAAGSQHTRDEAEQDAGADLGSNQGLEAPRAASVKQVQCQFIKPEPDQTGSPASPQPRDEMQVQSGPGQLHSQPAAPSIPSAPGSVTAGEESVQPKEDQPVSSITQEGPASIQRQTGALETARHTPDETLPATTRDMAGNAVSDIQREPPAVKEKPSAQVDQHITAHIMAHEEMPLIRRSSHPRAIQRSVQSDSGPVPAGEAGVPPSPVTPSKAIQPPAVNDRNTQSQPHPPAISSSAAPVPAIDITTKPPVTRAPVGEPRAKQPIGVQRRTTIGAIHKPPMPLTLPLQPPAIQRQVTQNRPSSEHTTAVVLPQVRATLSSAPAVEAKTPQPMDSAFGVSRIVPETLITAAAPSLSPLTWVQRKVGELHDAIETPIHPGPEAPIARQHNEPATPLVLKHPKAGATVQRAESDKAAGAEAAELAQRVGQTAANEDKLVPTVTRPDLDDLAQQIVPLIRRMLAIERERYRGI